MIIDKKKENIYKEIRKAVQAGDFALRPHTVNHMLAEGFNEDNIIEVINNGNILELYDDEARCLIVGTFGISGDIKEYLHVVADYWSESGNIDWVDFVTAYIPRSPFWKTPSIRGYGNEIN